MDLSKYRIYRTGPNNITIQKRYTNEWRTISYHGNSTNSLISGLFSLIVAQHSPTEENLCDALAGLRLDLISGIEEVKKMVEGCWNE